MTAKKCKHCNGSGEEQVNSPYRTAANKVKEVMKPVGNVFVRSYAKVKHGAYAMTFGRMWNWTKSELLIPFIVIGILAGGVWLIISVNEDDYKNRQTITVQFADSGQAVRCWVGHYKPRFVDEHNKYVWEKVEKIKPISEELAIIGAPSDMKCIDYKGE